MTIVENLSFNYKITAIFLSTKIICKLFFMFLNMFLHKLMIINCIFFVKFSQIHNIHL
jgi:hypothetical protein